MVTVNNVNSNEIGDYAVTYTATDAAGNTSIQKRNVTVVDTTPPKITLNGESTVYHCQHDVYNDAGVTVKDNSGKSIQPTTTSDVDVANPGKYTVEYVATDESENSTFVARTVYVVTYVIWETYEVSINRDGAAKKYTFHVEYDKRHKITWRAHMEMQPEHHGYYVTHMVFDFNLLEFISDAKLKRIENNVGNHPGMEATVKRIRADAPDPNRWNDGRTSLDLFLGFWSDDWLMSIFAEKGAGSFFGHEAHFVKSDQQSKPDLSKLAELMVHKSSKQKQAPVRLHHLVAGIGATESASSTV